MSTISLRLSETLHKQIRLLAKREQISINQLISTAVAEKLSALLTEEYLETRALKGDRVRFNNVLAKVKDLEPQDGDAL